MTTQPEALRLADELEIAIYGERSANQQKIAQAAAELRRLHEVNQGLLKAMVQAAQAIIDKAERTTT